MPHVSKHQIDKKVFKEVYLQLIKSVEQSKNKKKVDVFLDEVLTETEQVMIAKRLALVVLLINQVPESKIIDKLKISGGTINRYRRKIKRGDFVYIKKLLAGTKKEILETVVDLIFPDLDRLTSKRWKSLK